MSLFQDLRHQEVGLVGAWNAYFMEGDWGGHFSRKTQLAKEVLLTTSEPLQACNQESYRFLKENYQELQQVLCGHVRDRLLLFFLVQSYFHEKTPESAEKLESYLKTVQQEDFDSCGIKILRASIADGAIVRSVYRSEDEKLVELFEKYLPKPSADLFKQDGGPIPDRIGTKLKEAEATIDRLAERRGLDILEKCALCIQRQFRGYQKRAREVLRIVQVEREALEGIVTDDTSSLFDEQQARQWIRAGNQPYLPKCADHNLAKRIFNAAYLVEDAPSIRHLTAAQTLPNILDECLYGRQILAARYMSYRPAQLGSSDQENGDANVICFGPQEIDTGAWKPESVELILDMKAFKEKEKRNPCIFFKQLDLGFRFQGERRVEIHSDASISFDHTKPLEDGLLRHTGFTLHKGWHGEEKYAEIPYQQMISSNFRSMTAIQTLNFFRFLDHLKDSERGSQDETTRATITAIYREIATLDDTQLVSFLSRLHTEITDTAEFNFYGAYRIDLSLIDIVRYHPDDLPSEQSFEVRISEMIDLLNQGDATLYQKAKEKIPSLFKSKRFMQFLRSKVTNPAILEEVY